MGSGRKKNSTSSTGTDRQTTREERAAERTAKQEEAVRSRKRRALQRRLTQAAVAVFILAVVVWLLMPRPGSYTAGGSGESIDGVQTYTNRTGHTPAAVTYPQTPPVGGEHNPTWLNCGIYVEAVPNVYAVHSLEHGAVWVTYEPSLSADALTRLREHIPSSYAILSPYAGAGSPIVLSAWNVQLRVDSPDDPRIPQFFEEYWRNQNVPEPGALCTGGLDGPGRTS